MSKYLDPSGQPTFGIGICARCSRKFFLADLYPDPNDPGSDEYVRPTGMNLILIDYHHEDPIKLCCHLLDQIEI